MTCTHTRAYLGDTLKAEGFDLAEVSEYLDQPGVVVWVDFCEPEQSELEVLAAELGLHELAVEDALSDHQRPKVDFYDDHLFLSCHSAKVNRSNGLLDETEVNAFVNTRWIITVRKNAGFSMDPVIARWDRSRDQWHKGATFFLYSLLDLVIDGYFDTVNEFDEYYDEVSDQLFSDEALDTSQQRHWFQMRRSLVRFHRLVGPMRETVSGLMRREHSAIDDDLYPYFQDVYDHVLRVTESTEALRDLVATIVETNLSLRDYRQNQVMKKVTSWAAIIAVPTLITGYYGMNVPYPGANETWGAVVSLVLVVLLSVALFASFRRRGWL